MFNDLAHCLRAPAKSPVFAAVAVTALMPGIGMVLSFFAAKLQTSSLYGITPVDPVTYAGTVVTLAVAGIAACLVPALRAL